MTDKNPLAHYSGVLSEAVQESAAADVPASGAAALSQYLKDCEQHSIVPDVGGAFAFAFAAGFNLATTQAAPIAWPKDAQDVRDFFRSDFITEQFPAQDQAPCDEDRYLISANDFLSAVNWWADFPHVPREPQAAPAAVAVPDGAMGLLEALESMVDVCEGRDFDGAPSDAHMEKARAAISAYRAALAATPAAAAPVVLPEWEKVRRGLTMVMLGLAGRPDCSESAIEAALDAVTEPGMPLAGLRMLAGVSAPAAQAVDLPTVQLIGVKDGVETDLGQVPMPPTMKARELLRDVGFTGLDDDDGDGAYAMGACEQLIEYCQTYYGQHAQADAREAQLLAFAVSEIRRDEMEHEPVLYVSKGQLDNFRDPDGPDSTAHGRYLPARVTPAGKFTTPLFAAPQDQAADFQQRVQPWMMACFGPEISADRIERNHRFLEESLELVQSLGCTASEAHQLVDYVFGRSVGEPVQEAGGVMVTLAALCLASGLDMHACGETELARIWTKVEVIRAKQAAKPKHSPLPMHALQAQADARDADDAALIEWLSGQYLAADFHWGDPKTPVLVIEIPPTASVCGDFRTDVRDAIAAQAAQQGEAA